MGLFCRIFPLVSLVGLESAFGAAGAKTWALEGFGADVPRIGHWNDLGLVVPFLAVLVQQHCPLPSLLSLLGSLHCHHTLLYFSLASFACKFREHNNLGQQVNVVGLAFS